MKCISTHLIAKLFLGAAMASSVAANAAAAEPASPFRLLLGGGVTYGGDNLISRRFIDDSDDTFKAGGLVQLYGGGEYKLSDTLTFQNTIGYRANQEKIVSGGKVRFTSIPVDLLLLYSVSPNMRFGGGVQLAGKPELKGSGGASRIGQKYDTAAGAIVEGEYLFTPNLGLKLRYVSEKFKPSDDGGAKIDGSHAGLLFSYYF